MVNDTETLMILCGFVDIARDLVKVRNSSTTVDLDAPWRYRRVADRANEQLRRFEASSMSTLTPRGMSK